MFSQNILCFPPFLGLVFNPLEIYSGKPWSRDLFFSKLLANRPNHFYLIDFSYFNIYARNYKLFKYFFTYYNFIFHFNI